MFSPALARAASLAAWDQDTLGPAAFLDVLEAQALSYRELPGDPPPDYLAITFYLFSLVLYAAILTRTLPLSRSYAARAARAISRTRATIARRPLDR